MPPFGALCSLRATAVARLTAAIAATPSGSYANPAIALAAMFSGGQAALSPLTALVYLPAQIAGAMLAFMVVTICFPNPCVDAPSRGECL